MNINDAFPSNYLKASDLGTKEPIVTIAKVETEAIGRTKEHKPVIYFRGTSKGLVLNKTNAKKIRDLLGSADTADWVGKRIKLFATETEFSGEMVECIRVKGAGAANGTSKPAPAPEPDPEPQYEEPPGFMDDDMDPPF